MSPGRKTESIQLRVTPAIKRASERILWRLGLRMSDGVELFLRQIIIDEKFPFIVRAPTEAQLATIGEVDTEQRARKPRRIGSADERDMRPV
jgi:DNA-damage-inducible protein J